MPRLRLVLALAALVLTVGSAQARSPNVRSFDAATFHAEVRDSERPVVVLFCALWVAPCKTMEPIVDAVADRFVGKVVVGLVDIDGEPELPATLGVRNLPTFIVFKSGKEVARQVGSTTEDKLVSLIAGHVQ